MNKLLHFFDRIKKIWHSLSSDKQKLLDVMLEAGSRKILGDTLTDAYVKSPQDSKKLPSVEELLTILVKLLVVNLVHENAIGASGVEKRKYFEEAFNLALEDKSKLLELPKLIDSAFMSEKIIDKSPGYRELYTMWVEKTANYLSSVRNTFRMLSFNELADLWDSPPAIEYLATHVALKRRLGCDLFRVFVYDHHYFENLQLLQRLLCEILVQADLGINVRVCSLGKLKTVGKGSPYPVHAIGVYDQSALAYIVETPGQKNKVAYVDDASSIREATQLFSDLYFSAAPSVSWVKSHQKLLTSISHQWIRCRIEKIKKSEKRIKLL